MKILKIRNLNADLNADPDPDPATQINADPCRISNYVEGTGIANMELQFFTRNVVVCTGVRYRTGRKYVQAGSPERQRNDGLYK
jgi:hypothetical protein